MTTHYRSAGDVLRDVASLDTANTADAYETSLGMISAERQGHIEGMALLDMAERMGAPRAPLSPPSWLLDTPGLSLASCVVMAAAMRGSREPICERCIVRRICRYRAEWVPVVVRRELGMLQQRGLVSVTTNRMVVAHA